MYNHCSTLLYGVFPSLYTKNKACSIRTGFPKKHVPLCFFRFLGFSSSFNQKWGNFSMHNSSSYRKCWSSLSKALFCQWYCNNCDNGFPQINYYFYGKKTVWSTTKLCPNVVKRFALLLDLEGYHSPFWQLLGGGWGLPRCYCVKAVE